MEAAIRLNRAGPESTPLKNKHPPSRMLSFSCLACLFCRYSICNWTESTPPTKGEAFSFFWCSFHKTEARPSVRWQFTRTEYKNRVENTKTNKNWSPAAVHPPIFHPNAERNVHTTIGRDARRNEGRQGQRGAHAAWAGGVRLR